MTFHTANGHTVTENMAELDLGTFENVSNAYILDDTPSVMSLGKRWEKVHARGLLIRMAK